jgi:hypothetical protein
VSGPPGAPKDIGSTLEDIAREGPPLSVTANLSVTVDGVRLSVHADGDRVRVQVPSVWAGARVLQAALDSGGDGLAAALEATGLTAEIRVGSAVIAVAGAGVTPGRLARLLPVGSVKVRARALAAAALRVR